MKKYIFGLLTGIVLTVSIVVIADTINSNEVLYDNTISTSSATDVKGAIDDLDDKVVHDNSGYRLIGHIDESISDELVAGLYRYQGTSVNNYICFGTTNKNTCTSDTDKYMYRIIGFDISGKMKLIKKETLPNYYKWNSGYGVDWAHSELYTNLNGSYFLTNTTYVPDSSWSNRIVASDWHYATFTDANMNAATMASTELGAETVNAKIGLWYLHDYAYALATPTYSKNSWIHLSKNDTNPPNTDEWTISRSNTSLAWFVGSSGNVYSNNMTLTYSVRPVFYLRSGERIASGSGTITDPYILN